ncbi:acrosin-like [Athene cunicularia]|uniref:acrosin-like n=1 Tax=Athene cunicularia TaxID=194338 RepID=UPI000EF6BC89|nr:acrosin-like [Athene cunicularia]
MVCSPAERPACPSPEPNVALCRLLDWWQQVLRSWSCHVALAAIPLLLVLLALCWPAPCAWDSCGGSCGLQPMAAHSGTSHVVGGTGALPGAWPWIVSIQDPWEAGTGHVCGGSLISAEWVLTAAHCFLEAREGGHIAMWRVVFGATRLTQPGTETQVHGIKRLLVHPCYSSLTKRNKVVQLQLDRPMQCCYYVQLACMPNGWLRVSDLGTCYNSGWGPREQEVRPMDVLQEAQVCLIDLNLCNSSRWYCGAVHPHNMCAGSPQGGIGTCLGDSGGPLVCKDKSAEYFWLVGVTSCGRGCARAKRPGIYTSTQHYYEWILEQMGLYWTPRAAPTSWPWSPSLSASTPLQRPSPTPAQLGWFSSCPFPLQKLLQFFTRLLELLQILKGTKA